MKKVIFNFFVVALRGNMTGDTTLNFRRVEYRGAMEGSVAIKDFDSMIFEDSLFSGQFGSLVQTPRIVHFRNVIFSNALAQNPMVLIEGFLNSSDCGIVLDKVRVMYSSSKAGGFFSSIVGCPITVNNVTMKRVEGDVLFIGNTVKIKDSSFQLMTLGMFVKVHLFIY